MAGYGWKTVHIDCETAFPGDGLGGLPPVGSIIDMEFVGSLRGEREQFFPFLGTSDIYVREEMVQTFTKLVDARRKLCQIVIGSPSIGKSILLFFVALYQASIQKKPVLYIRKTSIPFDGTSAFYIRPTTSNVVVDAVGVNDAVVIGSDAPVPETVPEATTTTTTSSTTAATQNKVVQVDFTRQIYFPVTLFELESYIVKTYHKNSNSVFWRQKMRQ